MTTAATSRILQTIADYRQKLIDREERAMAIMDAYHAQVLDEIKLKLDKLYGQILAKYKEIEASREPGDTTPLDVPASWIHERIRLEGLTLFIQGKIDQYGNLALTQTRMLQYFGTQLGLESAQSQLHDVVPSAVKSVFGVPSDKVLANLVGATRAGSPLHTLFHGFGQEAAEKAVQALVSGVTMGDNPRTIAPRVQQALNISRARALTIARTEMMRCYRTAAIDTYRANSDVCDGWVWSAQLDAVTCISCILMNGTEHGLYEDLDGHPNCRCAKSPKTKSWDAILGPLGISSDDIPDTRPVYQSGESWFLDQDEATQRKILGNAKYDALQNGDFELSDIIGHSHSDDWGHSIYEKSLKDLVGAK
jgi:SPP1 gp7 family putative phage head morphogenesis protein